MPRQRSRVLIATAELIFATNCWGFGFIATIYALQGMGPLWLTALRFILATILIFPILFSWQSTRRELSRASLMATFLPGLFLSLTLILQTWGLKFTTATKSGFITCLYAVFVPLLEKFFFKRPLSNWIFFYVLIALSGMALIANLSSLENLGFGDFLTLLCAIAAAFHIISVGIFSKKIHSSHVFNACQSLWSGILPLFLAIFLEAPPHNFFRPRVLFGLAFLTFISTLIAFMLQIRSQKILNATTASMIFLLESPFAAIYAYWILSERLIFSQWIGGALIILAAIACIREEQKLAMAVPGKL